jgi:hypothetical protein
MKEVQEQYTELLWGVLRIYCVWKGCSTLGDMQMKSYTGNLNWNIHFVLFRTQNEVMVT